MIPSIARRSLALLVAALGAILAVLSVNAPAAQAYSVLVSSSIKDGARLAEAPKQLVLTFNESIQPEFNQVALTGPDGAVKLADPATKGPALTVPFPDLDAGAYKAVYRVVSADGHVIDGSISFTVLAPKVTPTPTPTPTATPTVSPTPTPTSSASASPSPSTTAASTEGDDSGRTRLVQALGLVAIAAVAAWAFNRQRRRTS